MRIVSLVENTTQKEMPVEHGLSLYIETGGHKLLFDTGQSELFLENAESLGVDLSQVDLCVLSHGHYDHGGGLKAFTQVNHKADIYLHKDAFGQHFHGAERYIGLNQSWLQDEAFVSRLHYVSGITKLDEHLTIYDAVGRHKKIQMGAAGLTRKVGDNFEPEDFRHEHYLMIEEHGKKVLISGCSHQGIINIMEWFQPDVCVGGFHFMKKPLDETLKEYAQALDGYDCDYYTCHCTGEEQYEYIRQFMNRVQYLHEGGRIDV